MKRQLLALAQRGRALFARWSWTGYRIALLGFAAIACCQLLGIEWFPFCILEHFPPYSCPATLILAVIGLLLGRRLGWLALVLSGFFGWQIARLYLPTPPATAEPKLKVLCFNVFHHNQRHAEVLTALQQADADVLFLTEMDPAWLEALRPLEGKYPYRSVITRHGNWFLSKQSLLRADIIRTDLATVQAADAAAGGPLGLASAELWHENEVQVITVATAAGPVRIAGIHPPTPRRGQCIIEQRAMALVCKQQLGSSGPRLIVGDFNTTCFSPTFQFYLDQCGLHDSAQGYGYQPTWGRIFRGRSWLPWLGVAIDHVLVSPDIQVLSRQVGPDLGSDHRWVAVTLGW
jgi:endonuclease/exonuclease/phosphatase (EEP) superfamily protein YafD